MNTLDLFGNEPSTYRGSLWLYQSTQGITALGAQHAAVDSVEEQLREYAQLPLQFVRTATTAAQAYKNRINVAVVTQVQSGDVVSKAPIEDGWFPPGDPRR
jgi:hypothetical protein